MSLKFCFGNEIHKCLKIPGTFDQLREALAQTFKVQSFYIQYEDQEGDKITLTNHKEYQEMVESEVSKSGKSVKIFIVPCDGSVVSQAKPNIQKIEPKDSEVKMILTDHEFLKSEIALLVQEELKRQLPSIIEAVKISCLSDQQPKCEAQIKVSEQPKPVNQVIEKEQIKEQAIKVEPKILPPKEQVQKLTESQKVPSMPSSNKYSSELVKEVATAPEIIYEKDIVIYKTVEIRNNGKNQWPQGISIITTGNLKGDTAVVQPLAPGKKMTTVLIIRSPQKAGKYVMPWRVCVTEGDDASFVGNEFYVEFEVYPNKSNVVSQPMVFYEPMPIKKEETVKKDVSKTYTADVIEKATTLKELFPTNPLDFYLDTVALEKTKSINELISDYLALSNNKN